MATLFVINIKPPLCNLAKILKTLFTFLEKNLIGTAPCKLLFSDICPDRCPVLPYTIASREVCMLWPTYKSHTIRKWKKAPQCVRKETTGKQKSVNTKLL